MKKVILLLGLVVFGHVLAAQTDKGYLTGSLESNSYYYMDDKKTGAFIGDTDPFATANYLKLDYYKGRFSAGMQLEGHLPAVLDLRPYLHGFNLGNIYATWQDDDFSVTAGTFYEQFGSGLLFRSWEDRALGLNNAVIGARFTYNYKDIVSFKALWGLPRLGMGIFTSNVQRELYPTNKDTQVRGADVSFAISNLVGWTDLYLAIEASGLNRYEPDLSPDYVELGGKSSTFGWSGRLNFECSGFFAKAEYVDAGNKYHSDGAGEYFIKKGNAQLIDFGYNGKGLGVTVTGRRLEWMRSEILTGNNSPLNMMNYVPALCTQYTYMLTNLHPYSSQVGEYLGGFMNSGEIGGQVDAFYNFRRGTALGGKRGMKIHANFSTYYTIDEEGTYKAGALVFRDFSFDIEKQWNKKFKTMLLYSHQEYNSSKPAGSLNEMINQDIFVLDMLYKYTDRFSTRLELQYLLTKDDDKDWMAALLEVNFAPRWSLFVSDMFNHGSTKVHYYNAGVSYTKSRTRLALGYGRFKGGFICSGGVCREISPYTGANLTLTTSF